MKRFPVILLLLLMFLTTVGTALAAQPFDTIVEEGEVINNDIIAFDGDVEIKEGATVNGDVIVFNGDARLAGTINGDLVLFNGNLAASSPAVLDGNCVLLNGNMNTDAESTLRCSDIENFPLVVPNLMNDFHLAMPARPEPLTRPFVGGTFFAGVAMAAGRSLLLGVLAFVAASLLPQQMSRTSEAVRSRPLASGAVGLLTVVAVPSLAVMLLIISVLLILVCIGLLGFPLVFAMLLALAAGALFGWISVGNVLGQRLADSFRLKNRSLPVTAALGTAILTFMLGLIGALPIVFGAGLLTFLALCLGLGATALTKFGSRPYPDVNVLEDKDKVTAVLETLPPTERDSL